MLLESTLWFDSDILTSFLTHTDTELHAVTMVTTYELELSVNLLQIYIKIADYRAHPEVQICI